MTLQAVQGIAFPFMPSGIGANFFTPSLIDAATEKFTWIGPVWNKDRSNARSIRKVGFMPGAITSAGGSTMRLSLQNVDATTGNPPRPDGTQDQTVDFLASAVTANTWYQTAALSADRAVNFGEMLAVVLEFQSFAGADLFNVQNIANSLNYGNPLTVAFIGTPAWAGQQLGNNIILEFDDGTFGTLGNPEVISSAFPTTSLGSGSTPDEYALRFTIPFKCKVDGAWGFVSSGATARGFDVVLYDGTTALATVSVDSDHMLTYTNRPFKVNFAEQTLNPGTIYRLAIKPNTAGAINIYRFSVANANHMQALPGGTGMYLSTRTDAGAWTDDTTQRLQAGVFISALDDGAGGGLLVHPGMAGGIRG